MDGREAEQLARTYLEAQGLLWVTANYRTRRGEIDLIMRDGEQWVFVEVRSRSSDRFGSAAHTITPTKMRRLTAAATAYLQSRKLYNVARCRFDVIAIQSQEGQTPHVEWIENAFGI